MKLPALLALLAFLFATPPSARCEDAITLRQQFTVGKRYEFGMKMVQESNVSFGGHEMEQKMSMAMKYSMTVRQHEDGKRKRVALRYGRVAMEVNTAGQTMSYDSDKKDAGANAGPFESLGLLVDKEMIMVLDEKDQMLDVENFDAVTKALSAGPAGKVIGQMFNKSSMKELFQGSLLRSMPDHPVKPGDSWPLSYKASMGQMGSMAVKGTYTYNKPVQEAEHRCALIGFASTLEMDMDFGKIAGAAAGENGAAASEMIKKMDMKVTDSAMTGKVTFDLELGMARTTEVATTMKMTMKLPKEANLPGGASEMTMPIKQTISVTLLSTEDAK